MISNFSKAVDIEKNIYKYSLNEEFPFCHCMQCNSNNTATINKIFDDSRLVKNSETDNFVVKPSDNDTL